MTGRPLTLRQIAEESESLDDFGRHFRDWLHELRKLRSRPQILAAIIAEPPALARRFFGGGVADAWLAAYADTVAAAIGRSVPAWTKQRTSREPWFADDGKDIGLRLASLRDSPPFFKSRNLFTPAIDLPLRLGVGRPAKSAAAKRRSNAERQRRFRRRQKDELARLRKLFAVRKHKS